MATVSPPENQGPIRNFRRSYKACKLCRRKKTRCITDGPGKSCLRCKRELRECVFPVERSHHSNGADEEIRIPFELTSSMPKDIEASDSVSINMKDGGLQSASRVISEPTVNGAADDSWPPPDANKSSPEDERSENLRSLFEAIRPSGAGFNNDSEPTADSIAGDLNGTLMTTLVSNGNDALKLLFQAALGQEQGESPAGLSTANTARQTVIDLATPNKSPSMAAGASELPVPSSKTLQVWNAFRFTRMGWFSSEEAVTYMDLFFKNLAPLSLVSRDFNPNHDAHFNLITQEPLLCCVILLISSRYHMLPGTGGIARSTLIHQRLWEHCQHLILRIIFGQEKRSKAKTRTLGAVEALLLMVEWHSRGIYFPPGGDGWDSSLLLTEDDPRDTEYGNRADKTDEINVKWFRDIVAPAKTSDRMSWMLLGCAQTLALELGLFDVGGSVSGAATSTDFVPRPEFLCQILYILAEQHSNRIGCASMIPAEFTPGLPQQYRKGDDSRILLSWLDLTNLSRTMNDVLFPSPTDTMELVKNGRYVMIVRRFRHQLRTWKHSYIEPANLPPHYHEELLIEYNHTRIFMNSLGIQAIIDRTLGCFELESAQTNAAVSNMPPINAVEFEFIKEVIDGSCETLTSMNRLHEAGSLRFCPVRIFLRVITASILLLKALSLGARITELEASLAVLEASINVLKTSTLDDMHIALRYGSLLEAHVTRFRQGMAPSAIPKDLSSFLSFGEWNGRETEELNGATSNDLCLSFGDWFSLPLDRSLAPFGLWGSSSDVLDQEDQSWDVLWSLPSIP